MKKQSLNNVKSFLQSHEMTELQEYTPQIFLSIVCWSDSLDTHTSYTFCCAAQFHRSFKAHQFFNINNATIKFQSESSFHLSVWLLLISTFASFF